MRTLAAVVIGAGLLSACSPVYVYRSAAGEARLLWRRRSLEKAIADPKTPPKVREELELARDVRVYAFDVLHLKKSKDYSTYSQWSGPYLTYLVTASRKTRLEPKSWWFPVAGSYPYKGHWRKEDALEEKRRLEREGWDVWVRGVASFNTPLPFSDPIPSTVLAEPAGELAELLIHELTHGTVYFSDHTDFDEGVATFVGETGARQFLAARFGDKSPQLEEYEKGEARQKAFDVEMDALRVRLTELYSGSLPEADKLSKREELFADARKRFEALGVKVGELNNAVVVGHGVYRGENALFRQAYEKEGRDWARTIELFRSLDKRRPLDDLKARVDRG